MRICFHHVISTSDLLTLIVGATVSFTSIGSSGSSPPHAANNEAAVPREIVLTAVVAIGAIAVMVFTLAGTTLEVVVVAIGPIVLAAIQDAVSTFLIALLVFSTNLLALLRSELFAYSPEFKWFHSVMMIDIIH